MEKQEAASKTYTTNELRIFALPDGTREFTVYGLDGSLTQKKLAYLVTDDNCWTFAFDPRNTVLPEAKKKFAEWLASDARGKWIKEDEDRWKRSVAYKCPPQS